MEIIKQQVEAKRSIKEKTWRTYERYMNELSKSSTGEDYKDNSFLEDKEKVSELMGLYGNSKRRVCSSIILVFLSPDKSMAPMKRNSKADAIMFPEATSDLYKHYHTIQTSLTEEYSSLMATQAKTDKQSDNWVDWKQILKLQRKFMNKIRREKYSKKETLTKDEAKFLQDYLVLSLYTLKPPRRLDYAVMPVMTDKEFKDIPLEDQKKMNCLVIQSKIKKFFAFGAGAQKNENAGLPGIHTIKVPPNLNRVLQLYLKHHSENFLLYNNRRNGEVTKDGLSKQIMKIMKDEFNKKISASMLRTIHNTHFYSGPSLSEKQAVADDMGHSVKTAELHYTKKD